MIDPAQATQTAAFLFPDLDLGDARRLRRFGKVVQAIAEKPGATLPELFPDRTDYNACLQLFDSPHCTHANILAAHQVAALDAMERHRGVILLIHDGTLLDFSGHTTLGPELGPIGNGGGSGWVAHQTVAVDPTDRTVFGLVSQILHVREAAPKREAVAAKRQRLGRESRLWQRALDEVGPTPKGADWIDVCDRGADTFEFLQRLGDRGRRFVVRSTHNRGLGLGPCDAKAEALLHDALRGLPEATHFHLDIPGKSGRKPRVARLSLAGGRFVIRPPHVRRGDYRREAVPVGAVRVWEANPPAGVAPLEWLLLTSEPVETAEQLRAAGAWYACRMQVEEFHKAQKTGAQVEGCQVQSAGKMAALVAVLSVVAVTLLNLRLAVRNPAVGNRPATAFVPAAWVTVLQRSEGLPPGPLTAREFLVALARMGGYHKNPDKEPPGWITLARGWRTLHIIIRYHNKSIP